MVRWIIGFGWIAKTWCLFTLVNFGVSLVPIHGHDDLSC
jgi:hypothetical protein